VTKPKTPQQPRLQELLNRKAPVCAGACRVSACGLNVLTMKIIPGCKSLNYFLARIGNLSPKSNFKLGGMQTLNQEIAIVF
jgi:hypothetical protein